jgi:hypothetical protein
MPKGPAIIVENWEGRNNAAENWEAFKKLGTYRNLATVWLTVTRGTMQTKIAFNWFNIAAGFNQPLARVCVEGCEVAAGYNYGITQILSNPQMQRFPYLLTVEEDNTAPPNALHLLYQSIQEVDAISGLYWLKGAGGCPQIWGNPNEDGFSPQTPMVDAVQRCGGIGMGFALWKLEMFKHSGFEFGNWFKTVNDQGMNMTQDLYFWANARKLGFKCAVDTRVKCGHVDEEGTIW